MSPEQIVDGRVDARSDLYALGAILFEMTTGRRPFEGDVMSLLYKIVHETAPRLADLSPTCGRTHPSNLQRSSPVASRRSRLGGSRMRRH
jgi:serine/threonine-protein kinase